MARAIGSESAVQNNWIRDPNEGKAYFLKPPIW